jgi:dipeptidyl aminopeptidase/acylaminoacyl peptidase
MNLTNETHGTKKRPFQLNDLSSLIGVSGVKLSSDGNQIVCVVSKTDLMENDVKHFITLITISDKQQKFITQGSDPSWSPDRKKIAYMSDDGELWIYNLENDQKYFLTKIYESNYFFNHLALKNFEWSPDGKYIAYTSTLPSSKEEENKEVKVINRLLYKTKGGRGRSFFADNKLTHVWIVPVEGGEPQLITKGEYNEHSISWTGDSRYIVFVSNRTEDPDNNQLDDLWQVNIETKEVIRLTEKFGSIFQPAGSPDGKFIAFLGMTNKLAGTNDSPSEDTHIYLIPSGGGTPRIIAKPIDRRIENLAWDDTGKFIYFTYGDKGRTPLCRVSWETGSIEIILDGDMHVLEYSLGGKGKTIAYINTGISYPPEIFLFNREQKSDIKVTGLNYALLDICEMAKGETIWFKSFDDTDIQGWLMKPLGFNESEKYPLVLVIHGGPHNMFGFDFESRMQILASAGYGVLYINPRGSHGYGQAFSNGCVLNWGGVDYKDLMAGVDYVIDNYSWVDKEKLGVTGQSYGGYMSNWIISQTDRFKAAVVDGGISNLVSFAGTSLYHSLIEAEFNGLAYDNISLLWQWSPLRNVKNVVTPTLFLHGRIDNEVPVSQAEEMFIALKKLHVKTSFVQYLDEGHGWRPDLKPGNRKDLFGRIIGWMDEHLK